MENMNNQENEKNLKNFKEFIDSRSESSNWPAPWTVIEPAPGDKIWKRVKKEVEDGAYWGFDLKSQEQENKMKTDR